MGLAPLMLAVWTGRARAEPPALAIEIHDVGTAREDALPAVVEPLSESEAQALFDGLPSTEVPEVAPPIAPEGGPPTGARPLAPIGTHPRGPLQVRMPPGGEVATASDVRVTFDRPMIALGEREAPSVATLTPTVPGRWRWEGDRALVFDGDGRLPMATTYTLEVPAGTRSASGDLLAEPARTTFSTPPPALVAHWPATNVAPEASLVLVFDQEVDPTAVLEHLEVAGTPARFRVATTEEVAALPAAATDGAPPARVVALRPTSPLRAGAEVTLTVPAGTPAAEGPRTTTADQPVTFHVLPELRVVEHHCFGGRAWCDPEKGLVVVFSTEITGPLEGWTVEPAVPGLTLHAMGNRVIVRGGFGTETRYRLTVPATTTDAAGQVLGREVVLPFRMVRALPEARMASGGWELLVLDADAPAVVGVTARNTDRVVVDVRERVPGYAEWESRGRRLARLELDVGPDGTTSLDLGPWLGEGGVGRFVLVARPDGRRRGSWTARVDVTRIGLVTWSDADELVVWASRLSDGAPLPGVEIRLEDGPPTRTDAQGLARLRGAEPEDHHIQVVEARTGSDAAWIYARFPRAPGSDVLAWLAFDDLGLYQPGDVVNVKGWLRERRGGDVQRLVDQERTEVVWELWSAARDEALASGVTRLSATGGFDLSVPLPEDLPLTSAWLRLRATGHPWHRDLQVPIAVFEERSTALTGTAHPEPGGVVLALGASTLVGDPLSGRTVDHQLRATRALFQPPTQQPWSFRDLTTPPQTATAHAATTTDASGTTRFRAGLGGLEAPVELSVESTVIGPDGRAVSTTTTALVHPASVYVGVRATTTPGPSPAIVAEVTVVTPDGEPARAPRVEVWACAEEPDEAEVCVPELDARGRGTCELPTDVDGTCVVVARVVDEQGRAQRSSTHAIPAADPTLLAVRGSPSAGEPIHVEVSAPFQPAEGAWVLDRGGLRSVGRFRMEGPSTTITVPTEAGGPPAALLDVVLVGADGRSSAGRTWIDLPGRDDRLAVELLARSEVAVGASLPVTVVVRGADGQPVAGAEVALMVSDEGVLGLTGHQVPDPVAAFTPTRAEAVCRGSTRELADGESGACNQEQYFLASAEAPGVRVAGPPPPPLRFPELRARPPARVFVPDAITDADGRVVVDVDWSDVLTRYRVTAVVADTEGAFGKAETTVTVSTPLSVTVAAQRVLRSGDGAELGVVVTNRTDEALPVEVAVRASGLALDADAVGARLVLDAGATARVPFRAVAGAAGPASVQVTARAADLRDASEVALDLRSPSTPELAATSGTLRGGEAIELPLRPGARDGSLAIQLGSSRLVLLSAAMSDLEELRWDTTAAHATRLAALAALGDAARALLPGDTDRWWRAEEDVRFLVGTLRRDGGWGAWPGDLRHDPRSTLRAADALAAAAEAGFAVPFRGLALPQELQRLSRRGDALTRGWALDVRRRTGDPDPDECRRWLATDPPPALRALVLPTLVDAGDARTAAEVLAALRGVAGTDGDLRADAIVLDALATTGLDPELADEVARRLLPRVGRTAGLRADDAFAIRALASWFAAAEGAAPDWVARAWLGDAPLAEVRVQQRQPPTTVAEVALPEDATLTLAREGDAGLLAWRAAVGWTSPATAPVDQGLEVRRTFLPLDDPGDVVTDEDGTVRVRWGARVVVALEVTAEASHPEVALTAPVPAGFVLEDPRLLTTASQGPADGGPWTHRELHADRAVALAVALRPGTSTCRFVARAATPGTFSAPAPRVEELEAPEVFGRGTDASVVVYSPD